MILTKNLCINPSKIKMVGRKIKIIRLNMLETWHNLDNNSALK